MAKDAKRAPARPRRSKAEVQEEFEAIRAEVEERREVGDAKAAEAVRLHEDVVRAAVDSVTVEGVVQRIAGLGLEPTIAANAAHITTLEKQLAEAKQQVQDIAVKAIEGASGARALSHINQIAMEQAKNRP